MKALTPIVTLVLTTLFLLTPETNAQTISDWYKVNLEPQELSQLLEAVHTGREQVLEFEFTSHDSQGRLEGCGYNYRILMIDNSGPEAQPIVAHGEIAYFSPEDANPYLSFSIALKYIKEHNSRIWERNGGVNYAYLRFGGSSLKGREFATASGAEEIKIYKYRDSAEDKLMTWLNIPDTLSIHFNRERSGIESRFDLSVLDHRDAWMEQSACYRELQQIRQ